MAELMRIFSKGGGSSVRRKMDKVGKVYKKEVDEKDSEHGGR